MSTKNDHPLIQLCDASAGLLQDCIEIQDAILIASAFINFLMFSAIFYQTYLLNKQIRMDHKRRKRQSTVDLITSIRPMWRESRVLLDKKFGKKAIIDTDRAHQIEEDNDIDSLLLRILGTLEHMAVGCNLDVYDELMIDRMSGTYLANWYLRLKPYIEHKRREYNTNRRFAEFEILVKKMRPNMLGDSQIEKDLIA